MALVTCQTGNCHVCEGGCACISDSHTGECLGCICNVGHPQKPVKTLARDAKYTPPLQMNLSAQSLPMAQLARLLEAVFAGRIAIPARAVASEVSVALERASLEGMAQSLGLVVVPGESKGNTKS
jgi:hypothetical protein